MDSAPDLSSALNRLLEEQGRQPLPFERIRSYVSQGGAALLRLGFGADLERDRFEVLRARVLELYQHQLCVRTALFPGMAKILADIESRDMSWGIVTNKPAWLTDPLVTALDLRRRAACVVSSDTTDQRKPHPESLLHACRILGLRPKRCLYIGDDPRDIQAGNAAGMTTLAASYGYLLDDADPTQREADGVLGAVTELRHWLSGP